MRLMQRNLKPVWYCLYYGQRPVTEEGYETGETAIIYGDPTLLMCNVSPATGAAQQEMFGVIENYDKIIVTDKMDCPINENTVLYIEEKPVRALMLKLQFGINPFGDLGFRSKVTNKYNYVVRRVAKSLNYISYAISKVEVS